MTSIFAGLLAALAWGVHDILVRHLGPGLVLSTAVLAVLATGTLAILPFVLTGGGWAEMTGRALALSAAGGLVYAAACFGLWKSFSIGPVKVVSPVVGAYPILSVGLAAAFGAPVDAADWGAVIVIVMGVGLVAWLSGEGDTPFPRRATLIWSALTGAAFAVSFALAQAGVRAGAEWPVVLVGRLAALAAILALVLATRQALVPPTSTTPLLAGMGLLDAAAISLVTLAGSLPNPEFAAVTTSIFGVITVILARIFLREGVTPGQWASIGVVFAGVLALGL